MINRDYILRMIERLGYVLVYLRGLRKSGNHKDALAFINETMSKHTGLTSNFVDSISEETLLKSISPMGKLNVETCIWVAFLLYQEGNIYTDLGKTTDSYYRYLKALYCYIQALRVEPLPLENPLFADINELITRLQAFELPAPTREQLFYYYEYIGRYDQAENLLFELLEEDIPNKLSFIQQGKAFYYRLQKKSPVDLQSGNFSVEEAQEGLDQLQIFADNL